MLAWFVFLFPTYYCQNGYNLRCLTKMEGGIVDALIFLHPAFHMHMLKKYFSSFYRFLMGNKLKDYMILNSIRFDPSLIFISIVCFFQSSILTFLVCFCINLLNTGQSYLHTLTVLRFYSSSLQQWSMLCLV